MRFFRSDFIPIRRLGDPMLGFLLWTRTFPIKRNEMTKWHRSKFLAGKPHSCRENHCHSVINDSTIPRPAKQPILSTAIPAAYFHFYWSRRGGGKMNQIKVFSSPFSEIKSSSASSFCAWTRGDKRSVNLSLLESISSFQFKALAIEARPKFDPICPIGMCPIEPALEFLRVKNVSPTRIDDPSFSSFCRIIHETES